MAKVVDCPTIAELISRLEHEFDVEVVSDAQAVLHGPKGEVHLRFAQRTLAGNKKAKVLLPSGPDSERLTPTVCGMILRRLGLRADDFGWHLEVTPNTPDMALTLT